MDTNEEREEKQIYLRENVIDKGYDPSEFVGYLNDLKGKIFCDIRKWR